ncbi:MAG: ArnT family glycosyltransferase [Anaerolineae bacterium]
MENGAKQILPQRRSVLGISVVKKAAFYWLALAVVVIAPCVWQLNYLGGVNWLYDETGYVAVAWKVSDGFRLYSEVYSPSPPFFTLSLLGGFALWGKSVWAARAVIVLYSAFGLLLAALLARELAGEGASLATAVLLFLNPEYFRLSRVTMSEVPAVSLMALASLLFLRYWRSGRRRWLILSGLALGAGLLVKMIVLFGLPLLGILVFLRYLKSRRCRAAVEDGLILAASVSAPFSICFLVYEPYAMYEQAFLLQWKVRYYHTLNLGRHFWELGKYLWKDKGLVLLALAGVFLGLKSQAWREGRGCRALPKCQAPFGGLPMLLAAWLFLACAMLMAQVPLSTHHLLPLLPPLAVFGGAGAMWAVVSFIRLVSERPPIQVPGTLWRAALGLGILGFYLLNLPVTLVFNRQELSRTQTPNPLVEDAIAFLKLATAPGEIVISDDALIPLLAGRDILPNLTGTDWRRLRGGDLTAEELIELAEKHDAVIIFWKEKLDQFPALVGWVEERERAVEIGPRIHRICLPKGRPLPYKYVFEDGICLVGARLDESRLATGGPLRIALFWEAASNPRGDYLIHLKLVDAQGQVWGEQISRPRWGGKPTNSWKPGQLLWDEREVELLPGTPPGRYQIEVTLFDPQAGLEAKPLNGERALLGPVEVPRRKLPNQWDTDKH